MTLLDDFGVLKDEVHVVDVSGIDEITMEGLARLAETCPFLAGYMGDVRTGLIARLLLTYSSVKEGYQFIVCYGPGGPSGGYGAHTGRVTEGEAREFVMLFHNTFMNDDYCGRRVPCYEGGFSDGIKG